MWTLWQKYSPTETTVLQSAGLRSPFRPGAHASSLINTRAVQSFTKVGHSRTAARKPRACVCVCACVYLHVCGGTDPFVLMTFCKTLKGDCPVDRRDSDPSSGFRSEGKIHSLG